MTGLGAIAASGGAAGRLARALCAAIRAGRLGHAYLIYGPAGAGKREFALALAEAALCMEPAPDGSGCGRCASCRALARGVQPDLRILAPLEGKREIGIDQVREACEELALAPFASRRRVLIVCGADLLREEAANAFLKTLEEPPAEALILLLTARPEALFPTVRSRLLELRLPPRAPCSSGSEGRPAGRREEACGGADQAAVPADEAGGADFGAASPLAEAAELLLRGDGDPWSRASRALACCESVVGESSVSIESRRAAVLGVLDCAARMLREQFLSRARAGDPFAREEAAIERLERAAREIGANATPLLTLEVLALDLDELGLGGEGGTTRGRARADGDDRALPEAPGCGLRRS